MEGGEGAEDDLKIVVNIKFDNSNEIMAVRVKPATKFERILEAFCQKNNLKVNQCRFLHDGRVIKKSDTPAKLGLKNEDTINFFTEKSGGGCLENFN